MKTGIVWEWVHVRNTSLHHADILVQGFRAEGYEPVSRFRFDNQLMRYVPGKGVFFFYDRDLMRRQLEIILEEVQKMDYAEKLRAKSKKMHEKVIETASRFQGDLPVLSDSQLLKLFRDFRKAITAGPLITVQLYGIEACWSAASPLTGFLQDKCSLVDRDVLSQSTHGKSIYLEEKERFLKILSGIWRNGKLRSAFQESDYVVLDDFSSVKKTLERYWKDFAWIQSEYVGKPFRFEDILLKCTESLQGNPAAELKRLQSERIAGLRKKKKLISKLEPPAKVLRVLEALNEFVAERDWAKGNFAKAFLFYKPFLDEIERRMGLTDGSATFLLLDEVEAFLAEGRRIPQDVTDERKKGFVFLTKSGASRVFVGRRAEKVLDAEGVADFFKPQPSSFRLTGIGAFCGKAVGKARVLESARQLKSINEGEILVVNMTTVEYTPAFAKIAGVVTDEGGLSSHAALVAREFKLPCVVGTRLATKTFKTGDTIEVDGYAGAVRKLLR